MLNKLFCLLLYSILISGCITAPIDSPKDSKTSNNIDLEKSISLFNTWKIVSVSSSNLRFQGSMQNNEANGNQVLKITFFEENSINLNLSTNSCGLGYTLKEDMIFFEKNITCTEACCDSSQDEFLMMQLSDSLKYYIQDSTLILQAKAGPIECKLSTM